jgi:hypothetical protein
MSVTPLTTYSQCACANCGYVLDYRDSEAGKTVECPKCGDQSTLPEARQLLIVEKEGPPIPQSKTCPGCSHQIPFSVSECPFCTEAAKKTRNKRILSVAAGTLVLSIVVFLVLHHTTTVAARTVQTRPVKNGGHGSMIIIGQPVVPHGKSTNDLHIGQFWLEKSRGSDMSVAVGDILNESENLHENLKADMELLDRQGKRLGIVSDYSSQLGPHQSWHVLVAVEDTNAVTARFAGVKEN